MEFALYRGLTLFGKAFRINTFSFCAIETSYMGEPVFYKWDGVGLSVVTGENLVTYGAVDIEPFTIHNQQYVAVANYVNDQDVHHLDSEVYMYNVLSGRSVYFGWSIFLVMETSHKFQYFCFSYQKHFPNVVSSSFLYHLLMFEKVRRNVSTKSRYQSNFQLNVLVSQPPAPVSNMCTI